VADKAQDMAGQAQQTAGTVVDQARAQAVSQLDGQKSKATDSLTMVSQALRQTSQQLRQQDQSGVAQYVEQAAEKTAQLAGYLRERDTSRLIDDVEDLARTQPVWFLGAAAALGFLGARFLRSSRPASGMPGRNSSPPYYRATNPAVPSYRARPFTVAQETSAQVPPYGAGTPTI
jgi:hypothetical protein